MATSTTEKWVMKDGSLQRRGRTPRGATLDGPWTILHESNFSSIPDNTTMTNSLFRDMWGLTGSGINVGTANAALFTKINEPGFGDCIRWTAVTGSKSGGISTFPPLPGGVYATSIMFEYDVWYTGASSGQPWVWGPGQGGKLPGYGGRTDSTTGNIRSGNAPTGGADNPYGISHRFMDIADNVGGDLNTNDELIGYDYLPSKGSGFPGNDHFSPLYGIAQTPMRVRSEHHMNSVASPGVGNPDGVRKFYVGPAGNTLNVGHLRYTQSGIDDLRLYSNVFFDQQVFSVFRGGADDTWGTSGPFRILFKNFKIGVQNIAGTVALP
jgi:hypothetical protein